MDLTKYAALNVKITEYSKVNNQFSVGRARVFYEGPNPNRTIINSDTAKSLIKTIPGTPIVGRYNSETEDFEGHGEGQIAYGFVPLDPNPMKVEVTEEIYGLPVKRTYYEVDAVIWDGRFPEAKKVLDEEKSLSMELNPETLDGEFEIYDDKHYLKITNAEFYGITVLGDGHTPCFKDAKFLQAYTSMLSAYEALEQESNIGGTDMPNTEERVEEVEVVETDSTITNEEAPVETEATEVVETEEVEVTEDEAAEETPTEDGVEEGTEEETEADEATEEEVEETEETETEENEEETTEEVEETEEETVEEETEETTEDEEVEAEEETAESEEEPEVEEETEAESTVEDETEALKAEVAELNSKLEAYETAAKEELVTKFSSKINDSEFLSEVRDNLSSYSVESLKATLGAKLAEQVLVEETSEEERVNGMIYSFNGVASKETKKGWQELVRATKEAANRK